jgi:threonine dehydrogenase-like Zn-dependent dehydrogenase
MPTVAINGLGRIGRAALKILLDTDGLDVVAVNDIADPENLAYLLRYDTVYGRYHRQVSTGGGALVVDGQPIPVFTKRDPATLPWRDLGVDLVLECTGVFTRDEDLAKHLQAGASYVILSAPTKSDAVPTVVHGVNRHCSQPGSPAHPHLTISSPLALGPRQRRLVEAATFLVLHLTSPAPGCRAACTEEFAAAAVPDWLVPQVMCCEM